MPPKSAHVPAPDPLATMTPHYGGGELVAFNFATSQYAPVSLTHVTWHDGIQEMVAYPGFDPDDKTKRILYTITLVAESGDTLVTLHAKPADEEGVPEWDEPTRRYVYRKPKGGRSVLEEMSFVD